MPLPPIVRSLLTAAPLALTLTSPPLRAQAYALTQRTVVGGVGGYDYVTADVSGRRLYIPRQGASPRITVFDLDTLAPVGEIPGVNARGVAVDPLSHHGFASSKPVTLWDSATLKVLKTIEVSGAPDGILFDPYNERVWVFSHKGPNATVIDAKQGVVVGTLDLGGEPEQAVSDGKGLVFVDLEDKDRIAVVDAAALRVLKTYDLAGRGGGPGGLAFDPAHRILFAACHDPATLVILGADDGRIVATLPIGKGTDGALFNPRTAEAFSSNGADGTLTVVKEDAPAAFRVEETVPTLAGARTSTLDTASGRILLIAAEFGPAPSPPPEGGRARRPMIPGSFSILTVSR